MKRTFLILAPILSLAALGVMACKKEAEVEAPSLKDAPEPRELVLIRNEPYMGKSYVQTIDVNGWEEGEDAVIIYGGSMSIIPYPWHGEDTIVYAYTNDHLLVRGDPQDTTIYFYFEHDNNYALQKGNLADTINFPSIPWVQGRMVGLSTDRSEKLKIENPEDIVCIGDLSIVNLDSLDQYPNLAAVGVVYEIANCGLDWSNYVYRLVCYRNLRRISKDVNLYVRYWQICNCDARRLSRRKNLKGLCGIVSPSANDVLRHIGRMSNLRHLELEYKNTRDRKLKHLANLKNLHTLNLYHFKISDSGLRNLGKIRSLRSLTLANYQPHTREDFLFWFENLTIFSWRSGECSERFDYLGFIEELPYQYGSLFIPHTTAEGWESFAKRSVLEELKVYAELTDDDLRGIGQIKSLRRLTLGSEGITDEGLKHLEELKNLKVLDIYAGCATEEGIKRLKKALPDCEIRQ